MICIYVYMYNKHVKTVSQYNIGLAFPNLHFFRSILHWNRFESYSGVNVELT